MLNQVFVIGHCVDSFEDRKALMLILEDRSGNKPQQIAVRCWQEKAREAAMGIKKGDLVKAIGMVSSREYEGKYYTEFNASFVRALSQPRTTQQHTERHASEEDNDSGWR